MKKSIILLMAVAAMLSACSSNDELEANSIKSQDGKGIQFDVYTSRSINTRAGVEGNLYGNYGLTTAALQNPDFHGKAGFGVFGYYTDNDLYDAKKSEINFMYNEQVTYADGVWTYEPVKYWPNEFGQQATSDDQDRLSFFAYAPYVKVNPTTGVPTLDDVNSLRADALASTFAGLDELYYSNHNEYGQYGLNFGGIPPTFFDTYAFKNGYGIIEYTDTVCKVFEKEGSSYDGMYQKVKTLPTFIYATDSAQYFTAQKSQAFIYGINASWTTDVDAANAALQKEFTDLIQNKNIVGLSRNDDTGDPMVKYVVDTRPNTSVDLLWGVAAQDNEYVGMQDGETIAPGNPYIDLSKQEGVDKKINWNLKHALARLNVQICTDIDVATPIGDGDYIGTTANGDLREASKCYLREISFSGIAMEGALNLHSDQAADVENAKPKWMDIEGKKELTAGTVTFYDGRKDGREGTNDNLAPAEQPQGLNSVLVEYPTYTIWDDKPDGVSNRFYNLFGGNDTYDTPFYVIPTGETMDITVKYDILTRDDKLTTLLSDGKTHGAEIENIITKSTDIKLEAGKSYTVKIYLGIESVKFDVTVEDWPEEPTEVTPEFPKNTDSASGDDSGDDSSTAPTVTTGQTYLLKFYANNEATEPSFSFKTKLIEPISGDMPSWYVFYNENNPDDHTGYYIKRTDKADGTTRYIVRGGGTGYDTAPQVNMDGCGYFTIELVTTEPEP